MSKVSWFGWIAGMAVVAFATGCHHPAPDPTLHGEVFPADGDARAVWNVAGAQAAAGARADATLHASHFDAMGLNSLGEEKLNLMLACEDTAGPMVVYLDLPADAAKDHDRDSVTAYLSDHGVPQSEISLKDGPNPHTAHPAADAANQLNALNSPGSQATGVPAAAPPTNNVQPSYSNH
jgi:hypothetical protein